VCILKEKEIEKEAGKQSYNEICNFCGTWRV